uniref:Uncharacterized protein n=1 Tax=viral metagenome TaxID=1070528 RepID=A0A6C0KYC0_9ZZZZ
MSSSLRSIAVLKQTRLSTGGDGNQAGFFLESNLKSAFSNNFTIVSKNMYLANTITDLSDAINTLNNVSLSSPLPDYGDVKDMGRTIYVGVVNGDSDILVFRAVKSNGLLFSGGDYRVGFCVISNKFENNTNGNNHTSSVLSAAGI